MGSPESNFHCGTCSPDLECKEDPISGPLIPDLPKKRRKKEEARNLKQEGETCGSSRREVCGVCENGLQCDAPMDACGHCINKKEHKSTKEANCYDEPDTGKCRALLPRFYYDKNDGECKQFYYGGCGGNTNNFETLDECNSKCKLLTKDLKTIDTKDDKDFCKLPSAVGDCRAAIPRWYYNEESKECEEFIWGGCDGNANNFATKAKCELRCK